MTDQIHKAAIIRTIEHLQLTENFIDALDDAQQANIIAETIQHLEKLNEQWN